MQVLKSASCLGAFSSGVCRSRVGRNRLIARASAEAEGVHDLLGRDRRKAQLIPELTDGFSPEPVSTSVEVIPPEPAAQADGAAPARLSSKERRERARTAAKETPSVAGRDEPRRCKDAIDRGLDLYGEGKYQEAIALFNLALELPGNGAYRLPGSPREFSCASDAEEAAALYNMACCYCALQQSPAALTCIDAILEAGYEDYESLRTDPDLKPLQGPLLEQLLGKYSNPVAKLQRGFFQNKDKNTLESDSTGQKPWILW